jgi:hypothetical protein
VSLHKFLDGVSQLTTTPVFQAVYLPAIAGNQALVTLDHGGHLFALIRMHDKHYFVVTHKYDSLWIPFASLARTIRPRQFSNNKHGKSSPPPKRADRARNPQF